MKHRIGLVLLIALTAAVAVPAQAPWLGTHYQPGNVAFSLGAGLGFGGGFGVSVYPGAEIVFAKIRPGNVISIDFGAGAKGVAGFSAVRGAGSYLSLGAAPVLTAHLGLRGFTGGEFADYLNRLDLFTALGVGYQTDLGIGNASAGGAGLAVVNFSGVNYFLTENIAVTLNTNLFRRWNSGISPTQFSYGVGFVFKTGPAEEIGSEMDLAMGGLTGEVMYASFASLYWASVALGGYLPSDDTFEPGDGIRFWHRYQEPDSDDASEIEFARILLARTGTDERWRYEFVVDDETLEFEALVDADGAIELLRYLDPATESIVTHAPADGDLWRTYQDDDFWTDDDLERMRVGTERITVPAGRFDTERLETTDDAYTYTWWLSDDVPGRVVKFDGVSADEENVSGDLLEILRGVTSPWGDDW